MAEIEKPTERYTTNINMWGMEIERLNSILQALTNSKLALHRPTAIRQDPTVIYFCSDLLMEMYLIMDSYIKDEAKKTSLFSRLEKLQDDVENAVSNINSAISEGDMDEVYCPNPIYKDMNYLHKDLLEQADILGLRIPFEKKEPSIKKQLSAANE